MSHTHTYLQNVPIPTHTCTHYCTCSVQEQLARDLWEAVDNDDVSKVRSVLGQGANPNHQLYWSEEWDNIELPPVHLACLRGYLEITRALVSGGADIEKGDGGIWGMTAFHYACVGRHMETVVYLSQEVKCHIGKCVSVAYCS